MEFEERAAPYVWICEVPSRDTIHGWQGDQLTEEGLGAREEHENLNVPFSPAPALLEILERM